MRGTFQRKNSYRDIIKEQIGYEVPPTEEIRVDDFWATHLPYRDMASIWEAKNLLEAYGYKVSKKAEDTSTQ